MATRSAVNPKDEGLLAALNERVKQLRYLGETMSDSEGEEYQQGFDAGVKWQRGQGDALARDLIGALTDAIQVLDGLNQRFDVTVLGGKTTRIRQWQHIIDIAEERA